MRATPRGFSGYGRILPFSFFLAFLSIAQAGIPGDVDGDGTVTMQDARLLVLFLDGSIPSLPDPENADFDQNGVVNLQDAFAIARTVSGSSRIPYAEVDFGYATVFPVGGMISVKVISQDTFESTASGTVDIQSATAAYDSTQRGLAFSQDGGTLYYHWPTYGLQPAPDYQITLAINDSHGAWSGVFTIPLSGSLAEPQVLADGVDLLLPYKNIGLQLARAFRYSSSYRPYSGALGGWTHTFSLSLTEGTDGQVFFFDSDGSTRYFQSNHDGTYQSLTGDSTRLTRDPNGSFQLRYPNGDIWRFLPTLQPTYFQDVHGSTIQLSYDTRGLLAKVTDSTGQSITLTYLFGRIAQATDSFQRSVTYSYTSTGDLSSVRDVSGAITTYVYDNLHRLTTIQFPDGRVQSFTYDAAGHLTQLAAARAAASALSYDQTHATQTATDALGNQTTITTNSTREFLSIRNPLGNTVTFGYDTNLNIARFQDTSGATWNFTSDPSGNVIQLTDPAGGSNAITYSSSLNEITSIIDPNGNQTRFAYTAAGDLEQVTYADGSAETMAFSFDSIGHEIVSRRLRTGGTILYIYDQRGLLVQKVFPDSSHADFTYDQLGNMTSAVAAGLQFNFTYDAASRLVSATYPTGRRFTYTYDQLSRRKSMTDPDGQLLNYTYDDSGHVIQIDTGAGAPLAQYTYDPAGRLTTRALANRTATAYTYDGGSNLTSVTHLASSGNIISQWQYTYDGNGKRSSRSGPDGQITFNHDTDGRLAAVFSSAASETYQYDPAGSRAVVASDGTTRVYTAGVLNQYLTVGASPFTYDPAGQLINWTSADGTTATVQYDAEGHPLLFKSSAQGSVSYTYDPFGRLYSRTDATGTRYFLWDGAQLIIEEGSNHLTLARHTWGTTTDEAIRISQGGASYFYHQDAIGSVTELTDANGNVAEQYRYRTFGQPSSLSSLGNSFLFTGAYYDPIAKTYYMRCRWFAPELGRYLTPNPVPGPSQTNLYTYALNDPIDFTGRDDVASACSTCASLNSVGGPVETAVVSSVVPRFLNTSYPLLEWGVQGASSGFSPRFAAAFRGGLSSAFVTQPAVGADFCTLDRNRALNKTRQAAGATTRFDSPVLDHSIGSGTCPTFIQMPPAASKTPPSGRVDVSQEKLAARIMVPRDGALLRSDVPIFGVAGGQEFKEYRIEYGEGASPEKWYPIFSSSSPQNTNSVGLAEVPLMQGDIDIRGNLATWNTGLKEWVHLPWHPADDPTDFNGTYTIRLLVTSKDGKTLEDRVTCEVGRVISQVLPGVAISTDKKVVMQFPDQALQAPFRVYTIKPLPSSAPAVPKDQELVGSVYTIREAGDRFMKPVILRFDVSAELAGRSLERLGIFGLDAKTRLWKLLDTRVGKEANTIETEIFGIPEESPLFAAMAGKDQVQAHKRLSEKRHQNSSQPEGPVLFFDTFETDMGEWASRDREFGAAVSRDRNATPDHTYCLRVAKSNFGGTFAVTVHRTPFPSDIYSIVSFDYKIGPGIKTDFYVRIGKVWYNIGFTDDENQFRYKDVGMTRIGKIENIITDGQWHSASFDLDAMLSSRTARRDVAEMTMADWDVTGYMKLDFGHNRRDAEYFIDNFKIRRATPPGPNESGEAPTGAKELLLHDFKVPRPTNLINGAFDVFSDPGTYNCVMKMVSASETDPPHLSLKYDVARKGAYGGFWSELRGASLSRYDSLSLTMKIVSGPAKLLLGLKAKEGEEIKVPADGYLSEPDRSGWRQVSIPLTAFKGAKGLSAMDILSVTFTNELNNSHGEVSIREIRFVQGLQQIPIADFEAPDVNVNLLGQKNWTFTHGAAAISASGDTPRASTPKGQSLRVSYGGSVGLDLGGGDFSYAAWVAGLNGINASSTRYLVFKIKGQSGAEKPNVYLDDGTVRRAVHVEKYTRITTSWQDVRIPLDAFAQQGIDLTHIMEVQFVFEWESMSGTIYLDDLAFVSDDTHAVAVNQ